MTIKFSDTTSFSKNFMKYKLTSLNELFSKGYLKTGINIRSNGDGDNEVLRNDLVVEGIIGEINFPYIFIFNNKLEGMIGKIEPKKLGYKFSWRIGISNNYAWIEFLDQENKVDILKVNCSACKKEFSILSNEIQEFILKGQPYCQKCKKELSEECNFCHKIDLKTIMITNRDNIYFCKKCYDNNFGICSACEEEVRKTNIVFGLNNAFYCSVCWGLRFGRCEVCGAIRYIEIITRNEEYNIHHCISCNPFAREIKNYTYAPSFNFKNLSHELCKKKKENNEYPLFLGVELEVEPETKENKEKLAFEFRKFLGKEFLENMFYLKTDGSINGFEIVSHPFTLQYSHKNLKWKKILDWLIDKKFTSYKNKNCGLHIHIGRNYLQNKFDISKMRIFFSKNKNILTKFSERTDEQMRYCVIEDFDLLNFLHGNQSGRYWAVNINSSKDTVELRLFRGTLNHKRFMACLQFSDAVVCFTKTVGVNFLCYNSNMDIWNYFIEWCKKQTKYNHFIKYMSSKNKGEEI